MRPLDRQHLGFETNVGRLLAWISVCFCLALYTPAAFSTTSPSNLCQKSVLQVEEREGLPQHLLGAIAQIESGRLNKAKKKIEPWPWAININGQGYFFATKEAAIKAIRQHQARGVKNIDVGCMQVNLVHHGHAFSSIAHALEPTHNVAYAARFLKKLKQAHASWDMAVAHYHSATPFHHIPYHQRVYHTWLRAQEGNQKPAALSGLLSSTYYSYLARGPARISRKGVGRRFLITATPFSQNPVRLRHIRSYKVIGATYQNGIRILRGRGS